MPAILTLQQIINALDALDDDELEELRDEIDQELEDRGPDLVQALLKDFEGDDLTADEDEDEDFDEVDEL